MNEDETFQITPTYTLMKLKRRKKERKKDIITQKNGDECLRFSDKACFGKIEREKIHEI